MSAEEQHRAQQQQRRMAVAAQQPSPAASNPAWAPIVTSGLSMERGRRTFGVVYISPILAAARALKFLNFALYAYDQA